jgi:hypothetical protein
LLLQIGNDKEDIYITLGELRYTPENYLFSANTIRPMLKIIGTIRPTLCLEWDGFKIQNLQTGTPTETTTKISISIWTAYIARRILNTPFWALTATRANDKIQRLTIQITAIERITAHGTTFTETSDNILMKQECEASAPQIQQVVSTLYPVLNKCAYAQTDFHLPV